MTGWQKAIKRKSVKNLGGGVVQLDAGDESAKVQRIHIMGFLR
jgi:hypothetical protein